MRARRDTLNCGTGGSKFQQVAEKGVKINNKNNNE
jgi:hypothetical protein